MIHKSVTINTRIDPSLKGRAEKILQEIGLTSAEAIRLFYKQICFHHGLPFEVKIPNEITEKAMLDSALGRTHKTKDVDVIFDELE